ncbi:MAG: hypothetical protein J0L81_03120 [Caulobacterales bacterium]|jgi:hypothetical protein|nr:hypothetical protein [Caulobacterales bacterium]
MKIAMLAARGGVWAWQAALADTLASKHSVRRFSAQAARPPVLMRALLALEARVFGRSKLAAMSVWQGEQAPIDPTAFDLIIDLTGSGALPGALMLHYDGHAKESFLWGRLLRKQLPLIDVRRSDDVLAASFVAIEDQSVLTRSLGFAFARARTLVERAVEIIAGMRARAPLPEPSNLPPAPYGDVALASFALARIGSSFMALLRKRGHWIVALRRGAGDFTYAPARAGHFLADPLLFEHQGRAFLFVEDLDYADNKGRITAAELNDSAPQFEMALEEPHHLSYPFVFSQEDDVYLMPECVGARKQVIYRAIDFPSKWTHHSDIFDGMATCDATIVEHGGRFWMFCTQPAPIGSSWDELSIYHSESPLGPWRPHVLNPVKSDARGSRPGGRMRVHNRRLFRPAQDCSAGYGSKLAWYEVTELTPSTFAEVRIETWSPETCGAFTGLHTYDRAGDWEVIDLKMDRPRKGAVRPRFTPNHNLKAPDGP